MKNWKALIWAGIFLIVCSVSLDSLWWGAERSIRQPWEPISYVVTAALAVLLVSGIVSVVLAWRLWRKQKNRDKDREK